MEGCPYPEVRRQRDEEPEQMLGAVALTVLDEGVDLNQLGVLHPLNVVKQPRAQGCVEGLSK